MNQLLVDFIAAWEGFRQIAYLDAVGVWTIGYGFTANVYEGDTMSREEADVRLIEELEDYGSRLRPFLRRQPTPQQWDALLSLAYNCGVSAIGQSGLIRNFNAGDDEGCADRFMMWNRAGGRVLTGLTRRREGERAIYLYGDYSARP